MKKTTDCRRKIRVEREVQSCVANYFLKGFLRDELPGLVTVAAVRMPLDFRSAKVYLSILGSEDEKNQAFEILKNRTSEFQRYIGSQLKMRYCPKIKFELDHGTDQVLKVDRLLANIQGL